MEIIHLRICSAAFLFLMLSGSTLPAQTNASAKIDAYVQAEMRRQQIPGVSLAVIRDGRIAMLKSYGLANVEHRVPVKPETVFQSGSIGKQFTAAAVMLLVQDGRISMADKITKFFPDVPASWGQITVRNLLNHTSGMGDFPPEIDLRRDYTEDEYFASLNKVPLAFEPGTNWDYSNAGYVTLGILIRKVTGKFYGEFLQERIFRPVGMTTARVISEADIVPNRAAGYRLVSGELKNQEWVSPSTNTTADGSLYLTILDLAKWDAALYTDKPLKQSTLAEIWAPATLNNGKQKAYGFGWHSNRIHNRRVLYHGGAWQGFKSSITRFVDDKLTIIFFANSWETNDIKLTRGLASIFYPEFALPTIQTIADTDKKASSMIKQVLLQMARGTANPEAFTTEFRTNDLPVRVKQIGETLNSLSLPVAIIHLGELVERRDENNLRVFRFLMTDLGQTLLCTVALTKDDKIAALEIESRD
jgi:CubicO group peptidase (beta-lactamase class C family)